MFERVLVANRGEIAVRIIRTLRRLGISPVAVYSDADAGSLHVQLADHAVRLGPASARESYLHVERLMAAAAAAGVQALHPGYGFLSERPELAEACAAAGVVFVGPSADVIRAMGDKVQAKQLAAAAGVPVVPGRDEAGLSDADLHEAALAIGLPVLLKPSAGGGGKGMRRVEHEAELAGAIASARREAAGAFGDDTLFVERFVRRPRHVEIQVLADLHGTTVHLGERECSLQRRHQKIVEEAPSPLLDAATRERMGDRAVAAARGVGYTNAGTVEFIVSADRPDEFFFMEMNTRLQVEHPVTEMVYGIDLVEWQLRVAAGEPLGFTQADLAPAGHAVEVRVYAEDPGAGFLPTGGTVIAVHEPVGSGVRIDAGVVAGSEVTSDYDPMLAKVIAHGADRAEALRRLDEALADTVLAGVVTNIGFLRRLLADPEVRSGDLDTELVERRLADLVAGDIPAAVVVAGALWPLTDHRRPDDAWSSLVGWRHGRRALMSAAFAVGEVEVTADVVAGGPGHWLVALGGADPQQAELRRDGTRAVVRLGGTATPVAVHEGGGVRWVTDGGRSWPLRPLDALTRGGAVGTGGEGAGPVRSPMPGAVVAVLVAEGDTVVAGQPLVTVEAMKMEHTLHARIDGVVTSVAVAAGRQVAVGEVLVVVDATTGP